MRKIALLATLLPVALSFAVPACSSDDSNDTSSNDASTSPDASGNDASGIAFDVDAAQPGDDAPTTGDDAPANGDDDAPTTGDDDDAGGDDASGDDAGDMDANDGASQVDANDGASQVDANDASFDLDATLSDGGSLPTVFVLRVGDGTAAPTSASSAIFLDEYAIAPGATPIRSIALPTAAANANNPIALSGTATSEGQLGLSADGHYVTLAGYAAAPGVAAISSTPSSPPGDGGASYARVVARVDSTGAIDTSTLLPGLFSGNNVRTAISDDGTAFWVGGAGTDGGGGVQYVADGVSDASVAIVSAPSNVRTVSILSGQLYLSSASSPFVGISIVGSGLPTSASTATLLSGFTPDAGGSDASVAAPVAPYAFVAFDLDSNPGLDTLYIADDPSSGGGVQKWTFDGSTWTKTSETIVGTKGVLGLTAFPTSAGILVVATTAEKPANLVAFVDNGTIEGPFVIASSPTNTFFRGVSLSPSP